MKNAVILHGRPSKSEYYDLAAPSLSNAHWLPWLQAQLLKNDIPTATPEVPFSFDLNWSVWLREAQRFDVGPQTILVGHSTGAGFWVKYLSIHPDIWVDKVILVAPWLNPEREQGGDFFDDFEIDRDLVSRTKGITIFNSDDDIDSVHKTVALLHDRVPGIQERQFHSYGHFCLEDMKTTQFPELLAEVLS